MSIDIIVAGSLKSSCKIEYSKLIISIDICSNTSKSVLSDKNMAKYNSFDRKAILNKCKMITKLKYIAISSFEL